MRSRYVVVLICVLACLACGSRGVIDGKLVGQTGGTDTACRVELHDEVGDPGAGLRCHEPGAPAQGADAAVVRVGQTFECVAVASGEAVDVTASCDGYEPYRSPPIKWGVGGFGAKVHHLGDIVLKWAVETASPATETHPAAESPQGFIYGRIGKVDGTTLEGRLRWGGGDEEAFWNDSFNGSKHGNPWFAQVPPEKLTKERDPIRIFGLKIADRERPIETRRQLLVRFGDIARLEAHGKQVQVKLKSGTLFELDRFEASDFDDDVRVWDGAGGVVDLDSLQIRTIEFLPTAKLGDVPSRLQGTVHTRQGDFTGFVTWNRDACVGTDELHGRAAEGERNLRFETLRSIARRSRDSSQVTLLDGRELVLAGGDTGHGNRGIYVDDPRYGRVLVSWDAFERVDFSPGGSGPAYGDFPPGRPLNGSVTTRDGRRLAGRMVYDLDESETTETLDAPSQGVTYTIPFGLIASIMPPGRDERDAPHATVTLHGGEELRLERTGDLGDRNGGLLIFVEGGPHPEYVPWADVAQINFDRPPA